MPDSRPGALPPTLPFPGPADGGLGPVPLRLCLRPGRLAVEVTRSGMVLGRHSNADVRLPLPDVSRRHCRFVCAEGRWQVIDLDSLNGVFVNDAPVRHAELHDGDRVRIGGFVFEVDLSGAVRARTPDSSDVLHSIADALPPAPGEQRRAS